MVRSRCLADSIHSPGIPTLDGVMHIQILSEVTEYPSDSDIDVKIVTLYDHTWYSNMFQVRQKTMTLPVMPSKQNGTGVVATRKETPASRETARPSTRRRATSRRSSCTARRSPIRRSPAACSRRKGARGCSVQAKPPAECDWPRTAQVSNRHQTQFVVQSAMSAWQRAPGTSLRCGPSHPVTQPPRHPAIPLCLRAIAHAST